MNITNPSNRNNFRYIHHDNKTGSNLVSNNNQSKKLDTCSNLRNSNTSSALRNNKHSNTKNFSNSSIPNI